MKRTLLIALFLVAVLFVALAAMPQTASAGGPCNGPYGGYAGCNYYGGYTGGSCNGPYGGYAGCNYNGGYAGYGYGYGYGCNYGCGYNYKPAYTYYGYGYNRVCYYGAYGKLYCSYVRVPAYPVSGYYPYTMNYGW